MASNSPTPSFRAPWHTSNPPRHVPAFRIFALSTNVTFSKFPFRGLRLAPLFWLSLRAIWVLSCQRGAAARHHRWQNLRFSSWVHVILRLDLGSFEYQASLSWDFIFWNFWGGIGGAFRGILRDGKRRDGRWFLRPGHHGDRYGTQSSEEGIQGYGVEPKSSQGALVLSHFDLMFFSLNIGCLDLVWWSSGEECAIEHRCCGFFLVFWSSSPMDPCFDELTRAIYLFLISLPSTFFGEIFLPLKVHMVARL